MEQKEIEQLKKDIAEADAYAIKAVEFSASRVRACISIGQRLNVWKSFSGSNWSEVVVKSLEMDLSTLTKWQRLAKKKDDGILDIDSAKGLRAAYAMSDLFPEVESRQQPKKDPSAGWLVHLTRLTVALAKLNKAGISPDQRLDILARTKPLIDMLNSLSES